MTIEELLDALWEGYAEVTPQAVRIHGLLRARGETIVNDHVALRTFACDGVGIDALERAFTRRGYRAAGTYTFPDKKLDARHYEHAYALMPKVFISELRVGELPDDVAEVCRRLAAAVSARVAARDEFAVSGRPWPAVDIATYERLREVSEYAAWLAAFGYRANHFTIDVGSLESFETLEALCDFLVAQGFELNESGGRIKGGPDVFLAQASTRAEEIDVRFADGTMRVPSCYYEFARRYPLPDGRVFSGFVAGSADKLFESTDVTSSR